MKKQLLTAMAMVVAAPAFAGSWDAESALCAEAIAAEAGVDGALYDTKTTKARTGRVKRLTVELRADGLEPLVGTCKIKRDEVIEVVLQA